MQLACVADRSPLLLSLRSDLDTENKTSSWLCTVVKIRPTLVHFLVNNRVWVREFQSLYRCNYQVKHLLYDDSSFIQRVIRSKVPITDVADYRTHGEARHKILISVADGNVWVVTLPAQLQTGVGALFITDIILERSSSGSKSEMVQWFCQLPGVLSIECARAGLTSFTLMRSLVTPSTVIVQTRGGSESKLQRFQSLELDDLEGEQSTCLLCLNSQESRHRELLRSLFPDVVNSTDVIAILQGDLDGSVRFSLICFPCKEGDATKVSVIRSGTLVQLDQPVQMIVPFTSFDPVTPSSKGNVAKGSPSAFNALLLLGTRGRLGAIHLRSRCSRETLPVSLKKLELGCAAQSLAFVGSLNVFVFCSNGSAFVFRSSDVLRKTEFGDSKGQNNSPRISVEKMPFQPVRTSLILLSRLLCTDGKFVYV